MYFPANYNGTLTIANLNSTIFITKAKTNYQRITGEGIEVRDRGVQTYQQHKSRKYNEKRLSSRSLFYQRLYR